MRLSAVGIFPPLRGTFLASVVGGALSRFLPHLLPPRSSSGIWAELRSRAAPSRRAVVLATVGINTLALALPIFILQVYDRVLPNGTGTSLLVLAFGLAVALAVEIALRVLRSRIATWTAARLEHLLRCRLMERILSTSVTAFGGRTAAGYLDGLNAVQTLRDFEATQRLEIRVDLVFAVFYLFLIAFLGTWLAIVPLALLVLSAIAGLSVGSRLHASVADRTAADTRRYDVLLSLLGGIPSVKALALNGIMMRRVEQLQEDSARAVRGLMFYGTVAQSVTVLFAQLNTVLLLGFGALLVLHGGLTLGALAACMLLSGRALQPIQTAMGAWANFQSIRIAREQAEAILALPSEGREDALRFAIGGTLELHDVTVPHPSGGAPVIDGVNLTVRPGEIVGIEGAPGSGKTTLLHVMLGLVEPSAGAVRADGRDLRAIAPEAFRRQTALLPRNGVVFDGTVLDNLSNFREGESVNEALYLAFLLGLDDPIRRLPLGFDTPLGGGDVLPAGLRQRIAIVRELVDRPKLILFDEADGGLDADSRTRLVTLLRQLAEDATLVLVSASPDILALASRRYRLVAGRLMPVSLTGGAAVAEVLS